MCDYKSRTARITRNTGEEAETSRPKLEPTPGTQIQRVVTPTSLREVRKRTRNLASWKGGSQLINHRHRSLLLRNNLTNHKE
jgi:hypothetical protein